MSFQSKAKYYSPGATNLCVEFADMALLAEARRNDQAGKVNCAWLSMFCDVPNLMIRKKGPDSSWVFVLGQCKGSACLVWPAEAVRIPGTDLTAFLPEISAYSRQMHWVALLDLDDYEGCTFKWRSPHWQWHEHPSSREHMCTEKVGSCLVMAVPEMTGSLMEVGARNAFWQFNATQIKLLGGSVGIRLPPTRSNLFTVVLAVVQGVLSCSEEVAVDIMSRRFSQVGDFNYDEFMSVDEGIQMMSKDEEQEFKKEKKLQAARSETVTAFAKEWKGKVTELRTQKAKTPAAKATARKKCLKEYKGPSSIPTGGIEQDIARQLTPPGTSIWRNNASMGWCGHCKPFRRVSKPASTHGHRGACLWVLRTVWAQWLELQGLGETSCPIRGLFGDKPSASEPGDQSASSRDAPASSAAGSAQ